MTRVYWFTQFEHGGFPIERAALGSCDLSMLTSTGNGNGWFGKQAATWRRVLRALQSMHNGKQKPLRWSSAEMAHLTRTDPTRNIKRFYVVDITPTLFGSPSDAPADTIDSIPTLREVNRHIL